MTVTSERGLVKPERIPGAETDVSEIRGKADELDAASRALARAAEGVAVDWERPLAGCFDGPMAVVAWSAMRAPAEKLGGLATDLDAAANAVETYAEEVDAVLRALDDLRVEARAIAAEVDSDGMTWAKPFDTTSWSHDSYATGNVPFWDETSGDDLGAVGYLRSKGVAARTTGGWETEALVPWEEVRELCERNDLVLTRIGHELGRWHEAEAACANVLSGLLRTVCMAENPFAVAPREAFMAPGTRYDWGMLPPTPDASHGVGGFFEAFVNEGVVGTFNGLTALLFGHDAQTQRWFDSHAYAASWGGLADQGQATYTVATLFAFSPDRFVSGNYTEQEVDAARLLWSGYEQALAWDTWSENPGYASGELAPGLLALFGGAWGIARTGTLGSHSTTSVTTVRDAVPNTGAIFGSSPHGLPLASRADWERHHTRVVETPDGRVMRVRAWDPRHPDGFVNGASSAIRVEDLEKVNGNRLLDRGGPGTGSTLGGLPQGVPASVAQRAAGPDLADAEYHRYMFTTDADRLLAENGLELRVGNVAPNLGQSGGGQQVMVRVINPDGQFQWARANELIEQGIIEEVTEYGP